MNTRIHESILDLVGDTPMVRLQKIAEKGSASIVAKLEMYNPGASVKDRIAYNMIDSAEKRGS